MSKTAYFFFILAVLVLHSGFNMHFTRNILKLDGLDKNKKQKNLKSKPSEPTVCLWKTVSASPNWLFNLLPRELSKYYQHFTPQTWQKLLVAQEACSWVNNQSLLTLPQGPVTLQLNPVGLVKSLWLKLSEPSPRQAEKGCEFWAAHIVTTGFWIFLW